MPDRQPDAFDRLWDRLTSALAAPISDDWRALGLTLLGLALFPLLLATSPAVFLNDTAMDVFIPLDGALRMSQGQWPHADFYTPMGALYYVLLGLAGPGAKAVITANLIFLPVPTAAAVILTRDRLPTPTRLALVAMVALMTISPRTVDSTALIGHLASYNRHGWVVATVVLAGVWLEPKSRSRGWLIAEIAALTVCTLCAFYLKITFFILAGAFLLLGAAIVPRNRVPAFAAGVLSLALVGLGFALGETNSLYFLDLQRTMIAGSDGESLIRADRFSRMATGNVGVLACLMVGLIAYIRTSVTPGDERAANHLALRVIGAGVPIALIGSQSHDLALPALLVLPLVCAEAYRARGGSPLPMHLSGAAAFALLLQPTVLDGLAIARHAVSSRSASSVPLAAIPGSPVSQILIPRSATDESPLGRVLTGELPPDAYDNLDPPWQRDDDIILRDAWDLIHRLDLADRKIASLTFSPTFPWMLGGPAPRHLPAWYDFRRTFSARSAGDPAVLLSDSDVILVPRVWRVEGAWAVYGPYVEAEFEVAGETPLWRAWQRKQ